MAMKGLNYFGDNVTMVLLTLVMLSGVVVEKVNGRGDGGEGDSSEKETTAQQLLLHENYYTMHQDQTHVTLKINVDGKMEWDEGTPTLYSVFREQIVRSSSSQSVTLEATATRYWICMTGKGRLYTIHQQQYHKLQRRKLKKLENGRIRHEPTKRTRRRWNKGGGGGGDGSVENGGDMTNTTKILPPADCLFKTYEFNPDESYERSVGIYSYAHSNLTHGRFLSISPTTGEVRSYRKSFSNLYRHHHIKITQVPIRYLKDMVSVTRFGRGTEYNGRVRQCILHLLKCPNHQEKIIRRKSKAKREDPGDGSGGGGGDDEIGILSGDDGNPFQHHFYHRPRRHNHHLYKIIQRCKRRAERTETLPKCVRSKTTAAADGGGGGGSGSGGGGGKRRLTRRSRRRRKSQLV